MRNSLQLADKSAAVEDVQPVTGLVILEELWPEDVDYHLLELFIHSLEHKESEHAQVLVELTRRQVSEVDTAEEHVEEDPQRPTWLEIETSTLSLHLGLLHRVQV